MNAQPKRRRRTSEGSEAGVAMLIAIFVMLLIGVVAIALILSSGTESALAGNYRASTSAYYAALAGLEEGRGRLLAKNPNFLNGFVGPPGTTVPVGQVLYITNPVNGENVLTAYPDNEYQGEFGSNPTTVNSVSSVSNAGGIQGPLYRWVRINAVTGKALKYSNDPSLLYYDGAHLTSNPTKSQALEITSLAVLPNGTQKMLQYVVASMSLADLNLRFTTLPAPNAAFPGALTLVGSVGQNVQFNGPGDPSFFVDGNDQCTPPGVSIPAIAYANGSDASGIVATPAGNYKGPGGTSTQPSVAKVDLPSALQSTDGLEALVQTITDNADVVLTPNPPPPPGTMPTYTQSDLPTGLMSPTNPLTIVVNGNLNVTNWVGTGYGLLLVKGTFNYDPSASWNGIVLVIGQGQFNSDQDGAGQISGAMLMAKTRDSSGKLLPNFGAPSFVQKQATPQSGKGIAYNSCSIKSVQTPIKYALLSFREIPQ